MRARVLAWVPALASAAVLAGLAAYVLRRVLAPGISQLPGTDTGNLYAWEVFTRTALASGELPFWNPYTFAGTPHLADTQAMVLYPPALILRLVLTPMAYFPAMIALHVWVGGLGGLFLARTVGLRWTTATAVGVATMFGGSVAPWLHNGHLLLLCCSAWMAWALGFAVRTVRQTSALPSVGLVAVLVLQFLAGYLQGSIYLSAAVAAYFGYCALWPESAGGTRSRPLMQFASVAVLTCGLAAFQLFPTARLAAEAGRTVGLPYSTSVAGAWTWSDLASFFFPNPLGSDRAAYIGWLLACFVPAALLDRGRRRLVIFFGLLAAGAIALTFGDGLLLYRLHYALFPGLRIPGRVLIVATPALAVCGAIGVERCVQLAAGRTWRPVLVALAVGGAAAVTAVVVSRRAPEELPQPSSWIPIAIAVAGGLAAVALARRRMPGIALALVAVVVAVEMQAHVAGSIAFGDQTPPETIRRWFDPPDGGRILSQCDNKVNGADLLMAGLPTVTGMGGVYLRGFSEYNERMTSAGAFPSRRDLWDAANVTRIISCAPLVVPALTLVSDAPPFKIYRNDTAWPRAIWTCGLEQLTEWEVSERLREGQYVGRRLVREDHVNIRWKPTVADVDRQSREGKYGLIDGERRDGSTWRYQLRDTTRDNVESLLADPDVEDTHGIDREHAAVAPPSDSDSSNRNQMLLGTKDCDGDGRVEVTTTDHPNGLVRARAESDRDGYLVFSEAYYPERRAFVDGRPAAVWRTNLAFLSVAVPAGTHDVELRFVPTTFYAGLATSGVTLLAWIAGATASRRRNLAGPETKRL